MKYAKKTRTRASASPYAQSKASLAHEDSISRVDSKLDLQQDVTDEIPYQVHEISDSASKPTLDAHAKSKYPLRRYESPYDPRLSVNYRIVNRKGRLGRGLTPWTEARAYSTAKNQGHRYRVGDVVCVAYTCDNKSSSDDWIAQILDIRSPERGIIVDVYALVVWFYRPQDLASGPPTSLSMHEVMPSSYLQVIQCSTIYHHAELLPLTDTQRAPQKACEKPDCTAERLIWRQTIDYRTEALGPMIKNCTCGEAVDFGAQSVLVCEELTCGTAHHQACMLQHAKLEFLKWSASLNLPDASNTESSQVLAGQEPAKKAGLLSRIVNGLSGGRDSTKEKATPEQELEETLADEEQVDSNYKVALKDKTGALLIAVVTDPDGQVQDDWLVTCPLCGIPMPA